MWHNKVSANCAHKLRGCCSTAASFISANFRSRCQTFQTSFSHEVEYEENLASTARRSYQRPLPLPRVKRQSAVALRYMPHHPFLDVAPRLVAKGQGNLAKRILELAKEHGVPIQYDPDLTAVLEPLEIDQMIPPELFQAVAVVLATLYKANGSNRRYD